MQITSTCYLLAGESDFVRRNTVISLPSRCTYLRRFALWCRVDPVHI